MVLLTDSESSIKGVWLVLLTESESRKNCVDGIVDCSRVQYIGQWLVLLTVIESSIKGSGWYC